MFGDPCKHLVKNLVQARAGHALFIGVERDVVRVLVGVDAGADLTRVGHCSVLYVTEAPHDQRTPLGEHRRKLAEIVARARLGPRLVAAALQLGLALRQLLGEGGGAAVIAQGVAHDRGLHLVEVWVVGQALQRVPELAVDLALVNHARQCRLVVAPQ